MNIAQTSEEDGTGLGDGLALAAARVAVAGAQSQAPQEDPNPGSTIKSGEHSGIKSKIVILLTDGNNNLGRRTPEQAARLAKMWGVKVYTIGIGQASSWKGPKMPYTGRTEVDEATLESIAAETGGAFWMAESAEKLHEIYAEIDKLEKTEIEGTRFTVHAERFSAFVLVALAALLLEQLLSTTLLRRVP
jgi:Ca-activated chloride channel family protein